MRSGVVCVVRRSLRLIETGGCYEKDTMEKLALVCVMADYFTIFLDNANFRTECVDMGTHLIHCGDDLSLYHKTPAGNTDAVTRRAGDVEKADPIQQRAAMTHNVQQNNEVSESKKAMNNRTSLGLADAPTDGRRKHGKRNTWYQPQPARRCFALLVAVAH